MAICVTLRDAEIASENHARRQREREVAREHRMQQAKKLAIGLFVVAVGLSLVAIGFATGVIVARHTMEQQAVENGAARYNPQTAEFEWIEASK